MKKLLLVCFACFFYLFTRDGDVCQSAFYGSH